MEILKFDKEYTIHVYETGPKGLLTVFSLFDYFQDIASDHATVLGYGREDLLKENNFWVLSRIYAEVAEWPAWGEKIAIRTWPRGADKLFALRDYEVKNGDQNVIARATSSWLIIDRDTRRIKRPDSTLNHLNAEMYGGNALQRNAEKLLPLPEGSPVKYSYNVTVSDLDVNLHTNNVRYLERVIDSYDLGFVMNKTPISVEINYLAESHFNENISIINSAEQDDNNIINHSILRTSDNTELCRLRVTWRDNHNN